MKKIFFIAFLSLSAFAAAAQKSSLPDNAPERRITKAFPNPATVFVNIELLQTREMADYSLCVYNFIGKKVFEKNNLTPRTTVDLSGYFRGLYIFQLKDRRTGQIIESGKFEVVR
ncbi:MAG: T9SS type A sorting domain-containing protein [Chitinophagaceae bacterium]